MRIVAGGAVYIKSAGVGGGENRQDKERGAEDAGSWASTLKDTSLPGRSGRPPAK